MGRPAGWMQELTGRGAMRSPGAPSHRREVERRFWQQIATGITSERAAEAVGVSQPVGTRWFRHRGGMPLFMSKPVSARYLSFAERGEIALLRAQDIGVREIARRLGRSPSTVSRELTRNAATRSGKLDYRASVAQWKAELVARRPKPAKLVTNPRLRSYFQDHLEGRLRDAEPLAHDVGVQAVRDGHGRDRRAGLPALRQDLCLELGTVDPAIGAIGMHKCPPKLGGRHPPKALGQAQGGTAGRSLSIRALVEQGHLQLGLFDERNLLELNSPDYPGERLVACRNPELAKLRAHKRLELLAASEAHLEKIKARVDTGKLAGKDEIGLRAGKVVNPYKRSRGELRDASKDICR